MEKFIPQGMSTTPVPQGRTATLVPHGVSHTPVPQGVSTTPVPQGRTATLVPQGGSHTPVPQGVSTTPVPQGRTATLVPQGVSTTPVPQGVSHTPTTQGMSHTPTTQGVSHTPTTQGVSHTPTTQGVLPSSKPQDLSTTPISQNTIVIPPPEFQESNPALETKKSLTIKPDVDTSTSISSSIAVPLGATEVGCRSPTVTDTVASDDYRTDQIENNPGRSLKAEKGPAESPIVSVTDNVKDENLKDSSMSLTQIDTRVPVVPKEKIVSPTSKDMDRYSVDSLGSGGAIYVEIGQIQPHISSSTPQTSSDQTLDDVDGPRVFSETPHSNIISQRPIPQSTKSREVEYARIQKRPKKSKDTSESIVQSPGSANGIRIPVEQIIDRREPDIIVETSDSSRNSGIIRGISESSMTFENYQRVPGTMIPISTCLLQTVGPGAAVQTTSCDIVKHAPGKAVPVPPTRVSSKPPRPTSKLNLHDNRHRSSSRRSDTDVRTFRPIAHQTSPILGSRSPVSGNVSRQHQRTKSSDIKMSADHLHQGQYFHGPVARMQSFQGQSYEGSTIRTPVHEGRHCDKPVSWTHSYEGQHYHGDIGTRTRTPSFVEANQRSPRTRAVSEDVQYVSGIYQKVVRSRSSVTPRANRHQQDMTKTSQHTDQKQLLVKQNNLGGFRPYGTVSSTVTRTLSKTEQKDNSANRQSVQSNQTSISVTSVAESVKCGMKELVRILYMPFACCHRRK
ncbi:flocculation protein FLO11-like, partial [Pecten maximus]|uniref:flocculation protein FLO11-like n=1 Tax=Pecten maximus TaxID=6579 RepID=UPI001458FBAF